MTSFVKTAASEAESNAEVGVTESDLTVLTPAITATSVPAVITVPKVPKMDRTTAYQVPAGEEKAHDMLLEMLTYRRPARSKSETKFINRFIIPLEVEVDKYGNYYKRLGDSPVVWCSHVDTVHSEPGRQRLGFDMAEVGIFEKEKSSCLGADDTAGVWLMVQMILARTPGLYLFHRDEEGGRKGSEWLAKYMSSHIAQKKFAIALDRKGTDSIITHQMSRRCCSSEFADSLAHELGMGYKADDTGSYTDTASYVDIVPECTNLSVGYRNAHSSIERQDREHLFKLRDKLILLDTAKLDCCRVAGSKEYKSYTSTPYNYGGDDDYSSFGTYVNNVWVPNPKHTSTGTVTRLGGQDSSFGRRHNATGRVVYGTPANKCVSDDDDEPTPDLQKDYDGMVKLIARNPEAVADILEQYGYGYDELSDEIMQTGVINC